MPKFLSLLLSNICPPSFFQVVDLSGSNRSLRYGVLRKIEVRFSHFWNPKILPFSLLPFYSSLFLYAPFIWAKKIWVVDLAYCGRWKARFELFAKFDFNIYAPGFSLSPFFPHHGSVWEFSWPLDLGSRKAQIGILTFYNQIFTSPGFRSSTLCCFPDHWFGQKLFESSILDCRRQKSWFYIL